ncbi:hypothetical protein V6N11_062057 [Hibiscus sabdariffa]|uniref:Uncharacterized protein n=1 Tax=Hibiscus sabdariffa TaxID=183260 RepID=A0ABR2PRE8_9ROSI
MESKDTVDSRSRGANNPGSRGARSGSDRYIGRGGSSHYSSNEFGPSHSKPAQKRANGTHVVVASLSSASEHKMSTIGLGDGFSSSSAWVGVPGQVSMDDIMKMGRPQNKAFAVPNQIFLNKALVISTMQFLLQQQYIPIYRTMFSRCRMIRTYEPDVSKNQNVSPRDECPPPH